MSGISFTKSKNYDGTNISGGFIYENGPENIGANLLDTSAHGRSFTAVKLSANNIYEAEFYNWNYSKKRIRIGIGIVNTSTSSTGSVTVLKSAIKASSVSTSNPSCNVGADMLVNFMNSSSSTTYTIPVNSSANATQGFKALINTTALNGQLIVGRVRFKVNSGANLKCKVFFVDDTYDTAWEKRAGWTNIISAADLKLSDPAPGTRPDKTYGGGAYNTGLYPNIQRYGALSSGEYPIAMGEVLGNTVVDNLNSGEFEIPTDTLPFSKKGNLGNYGIVYALYGTNSGAKTVRLRPIQGNPARYVVKIDGVWKKIEGSVPFTLKGGTSFWFILAGGNYGNVGVSFS